MAKRPELVVETGDLKGRRFAVGEGALRLGRSSSNDIHVPDEELSRNHCLFEIVGETGLRVTDLASANGTFVNGENIGSEPVELKEGDVIEVGTTRLTVGDPKTPSDPAALDLGLGSESSVNAPTAEESSPARVKPLRAVLWAVAVVACLVAIVAILCAPVDETTVLAPVANEAPTIREVVYERVKADSRGIFRYLLTLGGDGRLTVKIDDTTNNRHVAPKTKILSGDGLAELNAILDYQRVSEFDAVYSGLTPDPPAEDSFALKVVYSTRVKKIGVFNTREPEAFAALRGRLEAFSKSELGVWAISYSREKLIELAEESIRLGRGKWEDRDVQYGNLHASITAFEEALFYLETVDPKPACVNEATEGLARSKAELERRYTDQRFLADRALNLSQWETARDELKILLELVPDAKDDRYRDARQKLLSAESNLKKKGGK